MIFRTVAAFWRWWTGELKELVPERDLRKLANQQTQVEVLLSAKGAKLTRNQRLVHQLSEAACSASAQDLGELSSLRSRERVILTLDESLCLFRHSEIPKAALHQAGAILALELSRILPAKADEFVTAWFRDGKNNRHHTTLTHIVVRKDIVSSAMDAINARQARVTAIAFRAGTSPAFPVLLAPDTTVFGSASEFLWRRMAVALGLLSILTMMLALLYREHQIDTWSDLARERLLSVQEPAAAARGKFDELNRVSGNLQKVQDTRIQQGSLLDTWEEVAQILPDSAWLQGLSTTEGVITIEGAASDAEGLIRRLEQSERFANVRFVSPVFKNPGESSARFTISMVREVSNKP